MELFINVIAVTAVLCLAFMAIRKRVDAWKTRRRLYRLCGVSHAYGSLPRSEVRPRQNVA